jgi:diaminopimelate decarboxylase
MWVPERVDGALTLGGSRSATLAAEHGTPLLVLDLDVLDRRVAALVGASAPHGIQAAYAAKALPLSGVIRFVADRGLDVDVCSLGELVAAERAGVAASRIVLHGSGKSDDELRAAAAGRTGLIVVDDVRELQRLAELATASAPLRVVLRLNTGIEAHTHAFVRTGGDDSKFGIHPRDASAARAVLKGAPGLGFEGLHGHVGSQIADDRAFVANAEALLDLAAEFARDGFPTQRLIVGGGFGVAMQPGADDEELDLRTTMASIARVIRSGASERGLKQPVIAIEPGRTLVAPAGTTLYRVNAIKKQATRTFVVVDGGLNENPRPALYGSFHLVVPATRELHGDGVDVTICGRSCENDELGPARVPRDLDVGDLLAMCTTGAYTYSMASNYNRFPRPAVVGVSGGHAYVLARRESIEDVLRTDARPVAASR